MSVSSSDDEIPITYRHKRNHKIKDESTSESENYDMPISELLSKHCKQQIYNYSDSDHSQEFTITSYELPKKYKPKSSNNSNNNNSNKLSSVINSISNISLNNNINNNNKHENDSPIEQSTSPILLTARAKQKSQTKLTQFFTPAIHNTQKRIKQISPVTALKGTAYQGLNTTKKNKYDNLSVSEITKQLQNCQQILNDTNIRNNLPDFGKRLKLKIQLLDEALIRVKARNIIKNKNKNNSNTNAIRQRLNFNSINSNRNNTRKTNIIFDRNNNVYSRKLAKNLNKNDLNDLVNSIHNMSINPLDNIHSNNNINNIQNEVKIPSDLKCELYSHQIYGFKWMIQRETHNFDGQPYGGIIADEMGLGKTMQMIALMISKHNMPYIDNKYNLRESNCTLIVCPLSVMDHWVQEIKKYTTRGKLIVHKYHGNNRCKNAKKLIINYNVILTTYGSIQSEWNEWKKLEDDRSNQIKDIRKQIMILQRPFRIGNNDENDMNKLKKLKIKLQILNNKKYMKPVLQQIFFKRIVLDEAHTIKNYKSKTHKAICDIYSKCYWFMTATPIQNTLDDLYAAFHFLKYRYYSNYVNWKQAILNSNKGIQKIRTILAIIMLRRLKNNIIKTSNNNNIENKSDNVYDNDNNYEKKQSKSIQLPPKKTMRYEIDFNKYERFIYKNLSSMMNKIFVGYQQNGSVGKHFSQCLKMLLQLRQACNHLVLIQNSVNRIHSILNGDENGTQNMDINELLCVINGNKNKNIKIQKNDALRCSEEYMKEIKNALELGNDECPICLDMIECVSITICGHRFCTECLNEIIDEREHILKRKFKATYSLNMLYIECPVCRKKLKPANITKLTDKCNDNDSAKFIENANEYLCKRSSKLQKLMEILDDIKKREYGSKCVIFSQWTSMLDIIEKELKYKSYCRLDGKMTSNQRSKSINKLNNDPKCWIMLISLKAGGVGLNLCSANHVFLMDIWWNPAIEDQALDRVHRIGQTKNVTIHRIIINDSVEQKVLKLQEKKRKIAQQALTINKNDTSKHKRSVNLSARDLIDLFRDDVRR